MNPQHTYTVVGTYTVKLVAVDSATCNLIDSTTSTITVSGKPTAGFTASPQPPTVNTAITFTNTSTGGVLFKFYFGDGDSLVTASLT
ncbi:hypothetical protein ABTM68_19360, partial [Acinetobacter baumannii]